MNQWQYDTICATLKNGVPTLAEDLIEAMKSLVEDYQAKCTELKDVKTELDSYKKEASTVVGNEKK